MFVNLPIMFLKTVYHPVTNEPFEVPALKAEILVLQKGWNQTPHDPVAVPAVQDAPKGRGSTKLVVEVEPATEEWRGSADDEPVEEA